VITETITTDQKTAQDILRAADLLETKGWIQGKFQSFLGFCAIGALRCATNNEVGDQNSARYVQAKTALREAIGISHSISVPEWNDAPERTQKEVVSAFRRAAHSLDPSIPLNQAST
jgi:hypothetical protein